MFRSAFPFHKCPTISQCFESLTPVKSCSIYVVIHDVHQLVLWRHSLSNGTNLDWMLDLHRKQCELLAEKILKPRQIYPIWQGTPNNILILPGNVFSLPNRRFQSGNLISRTLKKPRMLSMKSFSLVSKPSVIVWRWNMFGLLCSSSPKISTLHTFLRFY